MCCFTINLSFSLLAKEFLKLVNIWQSCGQDYGVLFFFDHHHHYFINKYS